MNEIRTAEQVYQAARLLAESEGFNYTALTAKQRAAFTARVPLSQEEELVELAERARKLYWEVATSDDPKIAWGWSSDYQRAVRFFKATIDFVYPTVPGGAEAVYEIFIDCNESVAYCVDIAHRDARSRREGRLINAYLFEGDAGRLGSPRAEAVRAAYRRVSGNADFPGWILGLEFE